MSILRNLPVETQAQILQHVFAGEVICAEYTILVDVAEEDQLYEEEKYYDRCEKGVWSSHTTPIYGLSPERLEQFQSWSRLFVDDTHTHWESLVTFSFQSTVALLDVLLSDDFSPARRSLIRQIEVSATPLPLYGFHVDYYVTHSLEAALSCVLGLKLDVLTCKDAHDRNDSRERHALGPELEGIIRSSGWQKLIYLGNDNPHFNESEIRSLLAVSEDIRRSRFEPDFAIHLPCISLSVENWHSGCLGALQRASLLDFSQKVTKESITVREGVERRAYTVSNSQSKCMIMHVTRGESADTQATCSPKSGTGYGVEILHELMATKTWRDIRLKGCHLADEGSEDPGRHL